MKLLLYSHFFAPSIGGVETIVLSLASGLAELRTRGGEKEFNVLLVTQTPATGFDDSPLAFRVIRQPSAGQLWKLIRNSDVIHLAGPALAPLLLSLIARKPVVIEHHGFQTICPNGLLFIEPAGTPCPGHFMAKRHGECFRCNAAHGWIGSRKLWLLTFVRRVFSARAAANITPTHWLGSLLQLPHNIAIVHGLESKHAPAYSSPLGGIPIIAFHGRLVTTKGARLLLEAAKILKKQGRSFELLIIGDGPERASLEQSARAPELASHVRFTGRLTPYELDAALSQAAIVVVPSLGGEVFGLVVAENMLRSIPVVASDLGAFVEVLGEAGVTFRTGDAAALANELARLLDDPARAARFGQLARHRVLEFFSQSRMIEEHALLCRQILTGQLIL